MRVTYKELKNLHVETLSGVSLGHVYGVVLDLDGQLLAQYLVKHSVLSPKEYMISRDQVVRFTAEKIVVDDSVVGEGRTDDVSSVGGMRPSPAMMMED